MITKKQFDEVKQAVLDLCNTYRDEYYGTERDIVECAFEAAEDAFFEAQLEKSERAELKRLQEKYGE